MPQVRPVAINGGGVKSGWVRERVELRSNSMFQHVEGGEAVIG